METKQVKHCVAKTAIIAAALLGVSGTFAKSPQENAARLEPYQALHPRRDFFVHGDDCWAFLPPKCVMSGEVISMAWSPNGRHLVAQVIETPSRDYQAVLRGENAFRRTGTNQIVWYEVGKTQGKIVLRVEATASNFDSLAWRADGSMAFVIESSASSSSHRTQVKGLESGGMVRTWDISGTAHQIIADRHSNLVVIGGVERTTDGPQPPLLFAIDRNLRLVPVVVPEGYAIVYPYPYHQGDGLYVMLRETSVRGSKTSKSIIGRINSVTLSIERVENSRSVPGAQGDTSPIAFAPRPAVDGTKNLIAFRNLPVEPGNRKDPWSGTVLQIAGEVELFWDSPSDSAIAYSSQGLLMVREIVKCDKRIYEAALDALVRREMMMKAKDIGAAFHMFAADNEDALPRSLDDLMPYLKNKQVLDGFIFTATHAKIGDLPPATTEVGYIAGNGGRVVLYGDGHVNWVPDK